MSEENKALFRQFIDRVINVNYSCRPILLVTIHQPHS